MAEFICKLGNDKGDIIEKRFSAENQQALEVELQQKGYYIFKINPVGLKYFGGTISKKIKDDDFIIFNQEFRALLQAGLPATKGLDILIKRQKESDLGKLLREVRDSIETGSDLSEAFSAHSHRLPTAYVASLLAGERSGDLAGAIDRYVTYAKLTNRLRKNFKKSLYYPIFLVGLSAGLIGLMLMYVLPKFSEFYEGFSQELPVFTQYVMGFAKGVRGAWPFVLGGLVLLGAGLHIWRRTVVGHRTMSKLTMKLPLIGDLFHKYQLSQIFHSLSVMLKGGMPLLSCLEDLRKATTNPLLSASLRRAMRKVSEGESFTASIEDSELDTELSTEMTQVGESTGALPEMLFHLASFYDEEVQNRMEAMLSLLEPILLVMMAALIGSLLFAMYYPLFSLMGRL